MKHLEIKIMNFIEALIRLKEALASNIADDFKIDVCIKRFEFTYEVCWKALHSALREMGIIATNPRDVFDKASKQGLIDNNDIWIVMKNDRNDTSHEYNHDKVIEIYNRIPSYVKEFDKVLEKLKNAQTN